MKHKVAEAAEVSTATVSRVLSNGLHVRPEVRERVMAVVEWLGYRPKIETGYVAALKKLDAAEPPDAFFSVNSMLAAGALQAIRERNLRIPGDIALVTFDETIWASLVQPAITLIAQPTYEIGKIRTFHTATPIVQANRYHPRSSHETSAVMGSHAPTTKPMMTTCNHARRSIRS